MTTKLSIDWLTSEGDPPISPGNIVAFTQIGEVVDQCLTEARSASTEARATTVADRLRYIRHFRENLARNAAEVARQLCAAVQRSPGEFLTSEIIPLLDACRFLERNAVRLLKRRSHGSWTMPLWLAGTRHEIHREPLGVVLIIGPSNYPFFLPGVQLLQALTAGNAVLFKPAPSGVNCAESLYGLLRAAGLPQNLLQLLPPTPDAAIHALGRKIDKVFLTGSAETGLKVLVHAATTITPSVVELSGCDGALILPDADLHLAARSIAFGLTLNSGRTCIAPRRAFVWPQIAEAFTAKLRRALADRPKLLLKSQPHVDLVGSISEAVESGARMINGSIDTSGTVEGPLVLANVPQESSFAIAENWGPILCVIEVANEAEAVAAFHRSPFRLGASVFTQDSAAARRLARSLQVGSVCVNDLIVPTADGRLPFGGRKQSGFGVTRGPEGLLEMTALKVISTRRSGQRLHLNTPVPNQFEQVSAYTTLAYGTMTDRWRTMKQLVARSFKRIAIQRPVLPPKESI
ncbi:MAG TPA: aldehyde dehydrogenase family protein [Verrucomicrobiae bacterium]